MMPVAADSDTPIIIPAGPEHVDAVIGVLSDCNRDLRLQGIHQWDDVYPDIRTVLRDVDGGTLYVAMSEGRCIGSVCLNDEQEEAYAQVPWSWEEPVLVVHRLCVSPEHQGRGIASRLMDFVEELAGRRGCASIRLDAYTGNAVSIRFYEKRGYTVAGQVFFPRRELPFHCMEKKL